MSSTILSLEDDGGIWGRGRSCEVHWTETCFTSTTTATASARCWLSGSCLGRKRLLADLSGMIIPPFPGHALTSLTTTETISKVEQPPASLLAQLPNRSTVPARLFVFPRSRSTWLLFSNLISPVFSRQYPSFAHAVSSPRVRLELRIGSLLSPSRFRGGHSIIATLFHLICLVVLSVYYALGLL